MSSFFRKKMFAALALTAAVVGSLGCSADAGSDAKAPDEEVAAGQQAASNKGATGAAASPAGPDGRRGFGGHGPPGGPGFLLGAALHELTLTDAQRSAIEGAMQKAKPGPRPGDRGPMGGPAHVALIEGVRAGKVDAAAVLAKLGDEPAGMAEHRAALSEALTTLHDTLTKEQRRALIDSISKRAAEGGPRGGPPGRMGPDGPGGAPPPPDGEGFHGHGPGGMREHGGPHGGPLGFLLGGLNLTDAQKESIHKALMAQRPNGDDDAMKKDFEAKRAEMTARLELFAADTFDAKAFLTPPKDGEFGPKRFIERMVKDLAVVVPLLEPAQREALAAQLEKGPPPPPEGLPGGPPGMPGPGAPPPR